MMYNKKKIVHRGGTLLQTNPIPSLLNHGVFGNESAYFLGAILAANESYSTQPGDERAWLATVKHNSGICSTQQMEAHKQALKELANETDGTYCDKRYLMVRDWFPRNKDGFAISFMSDACIGIDALCEYARDLLPTLSLDAKKCILLGAFDGRSSIDVNRAQNTIRYITLDCGADKSMQFLVDLIEEFHFEYNCNYARERLEGGEPRKPQLRIAARSASRFGSLIGFISPLRLSLLQNSLLIKTIVQMDGTILPHRGIIVSQYSSTLQQDSSLVIDHTPVSSTNINVTNPKNVSIGVPSTPVVESPIVRIGDKVQHKVFGVGTVDSLIDTSHIKIKFSQGLKTFQFPGVFIGGFVKLIK